jgi:hypothetical protein
VSGSDVDSSVTTVENCLRAVRELRLEVVELRQQLHDPQRAIECRSLRVVTRRGAIAIGDIGEHHFGFGLDGFGPCVRQGVLVVVDDGEHSFPVTPAVSVEVSGPDGFVAIAHRRGEGPSALWVGDDGRQRVEVNPTSTTLGKQEAGL